MRLIQLIHGSLYYGQRWLLNRLVVQNVPNIMTGNVEARILGCLRQATPTLMKKV
ncbi:MAG: hypothetical protein V7L29_20470 [Nostoc sp.]|uniref:hypothetical protein n=1 Tax=Nostoc sp. TaxID=1180 RepID=UPI002FF83C43